ncbi:hypothetical protein B0O80DRAFT_217857 [Mortierella sp. GBAus27b]|nr:hypothetical protein B0O80DRAFT_217857 [Mortierella sp. GBAus27b]
MIGSALKETSDTTPSEEAHNHQEGQLVLKHAMESPSTPDPLQAMPQDQTQDQTQDHEQESGQDQQLKQDIALESGSGSDSVDGTGDKNNMSNDSAESQESGFVSEQETPMSPDREPEVVSRNYDVQSSPSAQTEGEPNQSPDTQHNDSTTISAEGARSSEFGANSEHVREDQTLTTQQSEVGIVIKPKLKRPPLRPVSLEIVPDKSILKKETAYPLIEQPPRNPLFRSQWIQSTVNKLAVMSGPAAPTAYTGNSPSMFRRLVNQATAATMATPPPQSLTKPPVFANDERPQSVLDPEGSSASLLSDKALKRVRFSVGQLTTEHVFHNDDAYESAEESEPQKSQVQVVTAPAPPKKLMLTTEGVVVDDNIYTAKEIMNHYQTACNTREEQPIERLIHDMQAAASRPGNPLLTVIDLTGEQLPRKTLDPIADVLTLEFGLRQLYLDNCGLEEDSLKVLLYNLLLTDTLNVLSLQDNKKIKATGFKYISVFVKRTKSLRVLNVSGIAVDKRSVEFLGHGLGGLGFGSRLEELRMDRCGLRANLLEVLAPAIRESNLRQLSMRSNRMGAGGGVWIGVLMRDYEDQPNAAVPVNNEEQGFKRVFPGISNPELLKRTHGVQVLDISDNDLRQGADYVAQTLRRNLSLKTLVMANNNLDPARVAVLADALKLNIGLEALDLSNNRVCGPDITGVVALTQKLAYNKTLRKLTLSNTGMQSEGAIALAEFLPETRALAHLDLTGNDQVDIAGVMALSVSIRMNKSLTCLDMNVPPNDPEFARLSRDILRACIRNMEEQTGSNAGMPSPDDMPTSTIFPQPAQTPTQVPVSAITSAEDRRWVLLESVAAELQRTKQTVNAMEKALSHEKALRRSWMEQNDIYHDSSVSPNGQNAGSDVNDQPKQGSETSKESTESATASPLDQRMRDIAKGILHRGPPQFEQLYHQCKRHQGALATLMIRVDNDKALQELESMSHLLNAFMHAYRTLFLLPDMPFIVNGRRGNPLPPTDSTGQPSDGSGSSADLKETVALPSNQDESTQPSLAKEKETESEPSFSLEDDDEMDDDVVVNDALIDARRNLLAERVSTPPPPTEEKDPGASETSQGRGPKPPPVNTSIPNTTESERSPSSLASPLEKLRKVTEEEEGEGSVN